tara:strand:+ start:4671 stop:5000 length:330 start_codon:yes stop_codon:yes gene_type:complete
MAKGDELISTDKEERDRAERWAQEEGRPPEQICEHALKEFNELASEKFWTGQKEHGGCLDQRNCITEAKKEVLDLWFYLCSAEYQVLLSNDEYARINKQMLFYKDLSKR